ncbi:MAG: Flp1 family type IVb pilin [Lachnospiraceae bacterium]
MKSIGQFFKEDDGMGTVEIILIIVVLIGLVIIFRNEITDIVESLFDRITEQTSSF